MINITNLRDVYKPIIIGGGSMDIIEFYGSNRLQSGTKIIKAVQTDYEGGTGWYEVNIPQTIPLSTFQGSCVLGCIDISNLNRNERHII